MGFVLGFHGAYQSGKDEIADYLISKYYWTRKTSFSKNLKNICMEVFKLTDGQLNTSAGKKKNFDVPIIFTKEHFSTILYMMLRTHSRAANIQAKERWIAALKEIPTYFGKELCTPREVIQFVGTDVCRALCLTYHIDILMADVSSSVDDKVIIPDVRFENEGEALLTLPNSMVVSVVRGGLPDPSDINREHSSETSMSKWDKFGDVIFTSIERDGIEYLHEEVDHFIERNNLCG